MPGLSQPPAEEEGVREGGCKPGVFARPALAPPGTCSNARGGLVETTLHPQNKQLQGHLGWLQQDVPMHGDITKVGWGA